MHLTLLNHTPRSQRGAATLITSLILLLVTSVITLYTGQNSLMEQRISINNYQGGQLAEASEAGVGHGIAWLNRNANGLSWSQDPNDPDYEVAGTELEGSISAYSYDVKFRRPKGHQDRIQIIADANESTAGTTRTSRNEVLMAQLVANNPNTALKINGCLEPVKGNPTVANDDDPVNGDAIVSSQPESCIDDDSGHLNTAGNVEGNAFSGSAWDKTFGISKTDMQHLASTDSDIHWLTPSGPWHTSLGSPANPAIVIFADQSCPKLNGGVTITGIVYFEGPCNSNGWGNGTVQGSVVMDGDMSKLNANTQLHYSDAYVENLNGKMAGVGSWIPGAWIDNGV